MSNKAARRFFVLNKKDCSMRHATKWIGCVTLWLLMLSGCAGGVWHTSDAKLAQQFYRHEDKFEALAAEIRGDKKIKMVGPDLF
jgi:hypothetical protein